MSCSTRRVSACRSWRPVECAAELHASRDKPFACPLVYGSRFNLAPGRQTRLGGPRVDQLLARETIARGPASRRMYGLGEILVAPASIPLCDRKIGCPETSTTGVGRRRIGFSWADSGVHERHRHVESNALLLDECSQRRAPVGDEHDVVAVGAEDPMKGERMLPFLSAISTRRLRGPGSRSVTSSG